MATARYIVKIGHPVLRMKARRVDRFDPSLSLLIDDMWQTMHAANGTGLSAPQIGESIRVLVAKSEEQEVAIINPEIVEADKEEIIWREGCLSIPGFVGLNIRRSASVTVRGYDAQGKDILIHAEGWLARVLQHEIDHLDGILYIDRLESPDDLRVVVPEEIKQVLAAKVMAQEPTSAVGGSAQEHAEEVSPAVGAAAGKRTKSARDPQLAQPKGQVQTNQPRRSRKASSAKSRGRKPETMRQHTRP